MYKKEYLKKKFKDISPDMLVYLKNIIENFKTNIEVV